MVTPVSARLASPGRQTEEGGDMRMASQKNTLIAEALGRANGVIAVLKELRDRARNRAVREDISRTVNDLARLAAELKQMQRSGHRHSLMNIANVIGRTADAVVTFLRHYPPQT
jgi:hypothetical protein